MRKIGIILMTFLGFSCKTKTNKEPIKKVELDFINSFYKNENDEEIKFCRITKDSLNYRQIEGKISLNKEYNTFQEIKTNKIILESKIDSIKTELKAENYREYFDNISKVIFVQIQPKSENDLKVLDLRHSIEGKIHKELTNKKLGEWIAGDLGPGGANMLFDVNNWNKSFEIIMKVLSNENLLEKSLILKRLNTAEDDWNYEIIYPIDFNGIFNQM
jgi:hypothetical protein